MSSPVYVFDSTTKDELSRVRGVGRYLQLLKENFPKNTIFIDKIERINTDSVFINPFFNFLKPPLLMKRVAKKQIAVIHDLIPLKYPEHFPTGIRGNINIFLNKLALRNYDLIVTDSQTSKKEILQLLKIEESRVRVIYPCLPKMFTESSQKSKIKSQNYNSKVKSKETFDFSLLTSNFLLYVGDATWNKNLVNLALAIKIINVPCVFVGKVFNVVKKAGEDICFEPALINHPWQKEFKEFIELTKNDKRFIFLGYIDDYKLINLYEQARVNILVSRDEGFGFSYLEAANFNCPSVLSNIPVLREISKDRGAYFANPSNPNDIANKIGEVYFNPDLRKKLGFEAQQQSLKFNQEKYKKDLLTHFK